MKSRNLQEMTNRHIKGYLQKNDIVLLPIGSQEIHGALLPQGADTFVARAIAKLLAEKIDALIAPPIYYTYAGGTPVDDHQGTIGMETDIVNRYLENLVKEFIRSGFKRIYLLKWHAPYYAEHALTRELFEKTRLPIVFYGLMENPFYGKIAKKYYPEGICKETAMVSAALRVLNKEHLLDIDAESEDQPRQPSQFSELARPISQTGATVGHYYTHESQHVAYRKERHTDIGVKVMNELVEKIAESAEPLAEYVKFCQETTWPRSAYPDPEIGKK